MTVSDDIQNVTLKHGIPLRLSLYVALAYLDLYIYKLILKKALWLSAIQRDKKKEKKKSSGVEKKNKQQIYPESTFYEVKTSSVCTVLVQIFYFLPICEGLWKELRPRIRAILEISENDNQIFVSINPGSVQQYKDSLQRQFLKHTVHGTLE